jgi:hypothetical protein
MDNTELHRTLRKYALDGPLGVVGNAFLRMNKAYWIAAVAMGLMFFSGRSEAAAFSDTLEDVNDRVQALASAGDSNDGIFDNMFSFKLPTLDGWFDKLTAGLAAIAALWALISARQKAVLAGTAGFGAMIDLMAKWRSMSSLLAAPKASFVGPMPQASVINSLRSFWINNLFSGTYWKAAWNKLWLSLAMPKIDIRAAFSNVGASLAAGLAPLRRSMGTKQLFGSVGASAAGAFVGSFIDGVGAALGAMLPILLNKRILVAIGSFMLTAGGLVLAGATVIGLIGIALFGPGDTIKERFRNIKLTLEL